MACDTMGTHDGQVVGKKSDGTDVIISNHCPRCDWFGEHRK